MTEQIEVGPEGEKVDRMLYENKWKEKIREVARVKPELLEAAKTELLFGEYFYKHLAPGGKAAVIVPEGVLFGSTGAHKKLRKWLLDECKI